MSAIALVKSREIPPAARIRFHAAETIRRLCPKPEPLSVTDWAAKYRMLPETSTSPGPYDPTVVPYARRPQDLMADPTVDTLVLCWASQTTKSTVLENGIAYRIVNQPSPMLIARPKIDDAEAWAKERLVPMILSTPALRMRVRLGRSGESTLRYKPFPGGFIYVPSAQSATELASRSAPFVMCDEVDRYENLPNEGNPVEIVAKRQGASDVGLLALTSTPQLADKTNIWPYLEGGSYEFYEVPCPHCGFEQRLIWQNLKWERGRPETAAYECTSCKAAIAESHKHEMLTAGKWVPTNPEARYPSFHLNALYSPFAKSRWEMLADEWERAQGKPSDLQTFVNTRLAELWQETADVLDANSLINRLEPLEDGIVPDGVGLLTAGVDVQHNRIEVYVWGWGAALESWLVYHEILAGDPEVEASVPGSVWQQLAAVLERKFVHASGQEVPVTATLVDSGYAATKVYRFTKRRSGHKVFSSKGIGGAGVPILGKPTLQTKARVILYPIGVDTAKTEFLRSQLPTPAAGPGFVHLPDWLSTDQCEQLVAEKRARRVFRGKIIYEWKLKTSDAPNEALDCRNYARAALELMGARVIAQLAAKAEQLSQRPDDPPDETSPEGTDPAPTPPEPADTGRRRLRPRGRGTWMRGFRS